MPKAIVKAVLSGDTVLLMGASTGGPPPEFQLSLASLQAPRLGRREGDTEEPFAWQSREFLRKLCIGKSVQFTVEYTVDAINRDFGTIELDGKYEVIDGFRLKNSVSGHALSSRHPALLFGL